MGMVGTSFAASLSPPPVLPFGEEVLPLTQEEMEDVEGAWGSYVAVAVVSAAFAGACYWTQTEPVDRNWKDGLMACAIGAAGALMGKHF
jgi:hypothetical protein